ncbi:hypothetical protein ATSB10_38100 [Dyella thiooxydans]|uniref:Uncharacterized protein n=1 Tax=Dyella thiooxydans TaxID=445710 RepID=A0A160N5Z9_9GAMM|nr:hypothetical protein ATSB10_38100 [Dyella thiooxydans]
MKRGSHETLLRTRPGSEATTVRARRDLPRFNPMGERVIRSDDFIVSLYAVVSPADHDGVL